MHIKERKTKNGISYDLFCSGRDPVTRESKVYLKTIKLPDEYVGKKKLTEKFLLECQNQWQAEVDKLSLGTIIVKQRNIKFIDFAKEWVNDILKYRKLSHNYYIACKDRLKVLEKKLGSYYLHEISPSVVKNFCKWLNERTYTKYIVTVKESLKPILTDKKMSMTAIAKEIGITHQTIFLALAEGERINKETATKICDFLNVPIKKYFDIETIEVPYKQSSNKSLKIMLHSVLQEAIKQQLIERNYASKDYTDRIKGEKTERNIFNDEEIKRFIKCVEQETDIRKKVAFSMYISTGLRNCELSGLEWSDIDFDTSELTIQRNCLYVGSEFGIITKETKTKNSNRTITIPDTLTELLRQYKAWWDIEKVNHGDLWINTNRLFCQNNGKDMAGSTLSGWLKDFQIRNGFENRITPHGLRHTNITMLISKGIDVKTVSARVGHADISTTLNIYSHFTKEADKKAADKIQEMYAENLL